MGVLEYTIATANATARVACDNPFAAAGAGVASTGIAVALLPAMVAAKVLGAVGFGAGIVKGSVAAWFHSCIGNVAGSSVFAISQSAGAGGYGMASVVLAVKAAGLGLFTLGASIVAWTRNSTAAGGM